MSFESDGARLIKVALNSYGVLCSPFPFLPILPTLEEISSSNTAKKVFKRLKVSIFIFYIPPLTGKP